MFPDIEECATHSDNCHADANCTNTKGSFYCTCLYGYYGDGVTCNGMFERHVISMCNQVVKSDIINTASEIIQPVPNFTSIPFWLPINLMGDKLHSRSWDNSSFWILSLILIQWKKEPKPFKPNMRIFSRCKRVQNVGWRSPSCSQLSCWCQLH